MHFRESIKSGRKEAEKEAKRKRNVKDDKDAKAAVADEYVGELLINKKEKEELENPTYLKTENYQSQEENIVTPYNDENVQRCAPDVKGLCHIHECEMRKIKVFAKKWKDRIGVATFVQGTLVQGDIGPRGQMSKGQLSKGILVRGDFFPRKLLPVITLLKLFFFILYWLLRY